MGTRRTQVWTDVTKCRAQAQEPPGIQNGGTIETKGRSQYVTLETLRDVLDFACQVGNHCSIAQERNQMCISRMAF